VEDLQSLSYLKHAFLTAVKLLGH